MATRKRSFIFESVGMQAPIAGERLSNETRLANCSIIGGATSESALTRGPTAEPWTGAALVQETKEECGDLARQKADAAQAKVEEGITALATALEAGNSEALTAFLTTMSRFHHYSFGNTILIAFQRGDATHVAGFNTWKSLGRNVMKGEKGIMILAPIPKRFKATEEEATPSSSGEQEATKMKAVSSGVWGFKAVHVFDISQTEGKELPQFARVAGDPAEKLERMKRLVTDEGIELSYSSELGGADGLSLKGRIEVRSGLSPAYEFSVLVHELAHELLHRDPIQRAATNKTIRETEAEAVAFVVSQAIGLDTGTQHADYIKLYQGNTETLAASLEAIRRTATRILSAI